MTAVMVLREISAIGRAMPLKLPRVTEAVLVPLIPEAVDSAKVWPGVEVEVADSIAVAVAVTFPEPSLIAVVVAEALPSVVPEPEEAKEETERLEAPLAEPEAVEEAFPPRPPVALPPRAVSEIVAVLLPVTKPEELLV